MGTRRRGARKRTQHSEHNTQMCPHTVARRYAAAADSPGSARRATCCRFEVGELLKRFNAERHFDTLANRLR